MDHYNQILTASYLFSMLIGRQLQLTIINIPMLLLFWAMTLDMVISAVMVHILLIRRQ